MIWICNVDRPDQTPSQFCLCWECPEIWPVPDDSLGVAERILRYNTANMSSYVQGNKAYVSFLPQYHYKIDLTQTGPFHPVALPQT